MFGRKRDDGVGRHGPVTVVVKAPETRRDASRAPRVDPGPLRLRRATKVRRSMPIRAYVGPNGSGKSLAAVNDLLPSLDAGRPVLSTVPLLDWRAEPDPTAYLWDADLGQFIHVDSGAQWRRPLHPNYRRLTEWSQLMAADHCDVFLDEVAGVASSRQSSGMPAAVERLLQKLRHADITLSWTAPAWARADLVLRETTQGVTVCSGSRAERTEFEDRLWKRNRQFEWVTYDAAVYTDWTEGKRDKAKHLATQRFYGPGSNAFRGYDTLGGVDTITSVTDSGKCVSCGGTRSAPKCSCPDYHERMHEADEARAAVVERVTGAAPGARRRTAAAS